MVSFFEIIGDVIYQDESVIITYNGIKEDEYSDGYSINFITENLTDKKNHCTV